MKPLDVIQIKMVVSLASVAHSMDILYIASAKIPEHEGGISLPSFYG